MRRSDVVSAVSDDECREIARRHPGTRTVLLPLVFEPRGAVPGFEQRHDLLFVGNFSHPPNAEAVTWFATAVLPAVRRHADVVLRVVGPGASAATVRAWGPHVRYDGWVAQVGPTIDAARVAVAPLRHGAGVKGKVGEALAMGLPCVATSVAAEGMDLTHDTHLLIADDVAAFTRAVLRAYTEQPTWLRLSMAGVDAATQRWSPEAMRARLAVLLSEPPAKEGDDVRVGLLSRSSPTVQLSVT